MQVIDFLKVDCSNLDTTTCQNLTEQATAFNVGLTFPFIAFMVIITPVMIFMIVQRS